MLKPACLFDGYLICQGATLFENEGALPPELSSLPTQLSPLPTQLSPLPVQRPTLYLEWAQLNPELLQELTNLALPVSQRQRADRELLRTTVLNLCEGRYLSRRVLAQLLNRNPNDLLKRTLNPLVEEKHLKPAFPSNSDPRQAYTTNIATLKE